PAPIAAASGSGAIATYDAPALRVTSIKAARSFSEASVGAQANALGRISPSLRARHIRGLSNEAAASTSSITPARSGETDEALPFLYLNRTAHLPTASTRPVSRDILTMEGSSAIMPRPRA